MSGKAIDPGDFLVPPGEHADLSKRPTAVKPVYESREEFRSILEDHVRKLTVQQNLLYASNRYALLLIFQGMDAAGKDSLIKHVMSGVNPQGVQVFSFKQPSSEDLAHDFLWRAIRRLPERGQIGIFNRSYYEEVLIVRAHPKLLGEERLPEELLDSKHVWKERYKSIVNFERHLDRNGTRIVKFFLHLSKKEQRKRFLARLDTPEKLWKFTWSDLKERKYWSQYREAYEDCLSATSTRRAPWYVVPADDKKNAQLIVSEIVIQTLKDLKLKYPQSMPERELAQIRGRLSGKKDR